MDDWFDHEDLLDEHDREAETGPPTLPHRGPLGEDLDANYLLGWVLGDPALNISSHQVLACPAIPTEKE